MDKEEYKKLIKNTLPKENRIKNIIIAFLIGGLVGLISQGISTLFVFSFGISKAMSYSFVTIFNIIIATLFTSLSFFDDWIAFAKCGLIIPTTGFAHSVSSCALDFKKDGLVTGFGANFFKLAGSVILYGIISSFIMCIVSVIFCG